MYYSSEYSHFRYLNFIRVVLPTEIVPWARSAGCSGSRCRRMTCGTYRRSASGRISQQWSLTHFSIVKRLQQSNKNKLNFLNEQLEYLYLLSLFTKCKIYYLVHRLVLFSFFRGMQMLICWISLKLIFFTAVIYLNFYLRLTFY